jgi:hypothetical protein
MNYAIENMDQVMGEIKPLIHAHWREIAHYQEIPLEPDWEAYRLMDKNRSMKIFTYRDKEKNLIGYAIYFVRPHLHYSTCVTAYQDILYVRADKRGRGLHFLAWCDAQLETMGVDLIVQHIKAAHNFGPALEKQGYELMDLIYTKKVGGKKWDS